ncbi:F-box/kelch-repeat protein At3g23880-like [Bidens hawaiensis]|uniref:F-box/kelch-repeat protein At3g23880-like n=1 Tax=Bidens hawaiensis TaxID=980011 RepID=UPI00404B0800
MANPFPEDIIFGILSRLPVKSLARFRCVCKSWFKYINDPYLHTIHVKEPTPIFFQLYVKKLTPIGFQLSPVNVWGYIKISFLHGTTSLRKKPVLELDFMGRFFDCLLVGSCNGLILVCNEQDPRDSEGIHRGVFRFALINPLSKERCHLPPIPTKMTGLIDFRSPYYWASGFGFDDSTNTLKTVFFANLNLEAYVPCTMVHSSGSSSWREVAQNPAYPIKGGGVFAHGRLYWLAESFTLVWFDVKREEFGLIDPPKPKGDRWFDCNELDDLNGQLGFSYYGPFGIKTWILKQHKEWVLHRCFDISPILPPPYEEYDLEILGCWNNDGDILLMGYIYQTERLFVYTLKSGDLREVDCGDASGGWIRMYQSSSLSLLPTSA